MIAKYSPVEFTFDHIMEHAVSIATCSILTCISMFGLLYLNERYEREKIEANNRQNAETGGVFEMAPKSMFRVKGIGGWAFMILILAGGLLLGAGDDLLGGPGADTDTGSQLLDSLSGLFCLCHPIIYPGDALFCRHHSHIGRPLNHI